MIPLIIRELAIGFVSGTLVLWGCSFTEKTENANFKTAVIYNAIMTALGGLLFGFGLLAVHLESEAVAGLFFVLTILILVVFFWLLKSLYDITFVATLWLFVAMVAVDKGVEKLSAIVF